MTRDFETILYQSADGIARIALNRQERLNAINATMTDDLRQAVGAANDDAAVRVVVLSGAGRAFCAGYDLDWGTRAEDANQRTLSGQCATTWACRAMCEPLCQSGNRRSR
jgi:enoyl-CoA hydratase/carnithine racemase